MNVLRENLHSPLERLLLQFIVHHPGHTGGRPVVRAVYCSDNSTRLWPGCDGSTGLGERMKSRSAVTLPVCTRAFWTLLARSCMSVRKSLSVISIRSMSFASMSARVRSPEYFSAGLDCPALAASM